MAAAIQKRRNYFNGRRRRFGFRRRAIIRKKPTSMALAKRMNGLARAVNLNRKLAYGHIQRNLHKASATLNPTNYFPICFQASNFGQGSTNAPIYQISSTGSITSAAYWTPYDTITNGYWTNNNVDVPDSGQYRALYANYRFIIQGEPNLDSTQVRIDFIQPRYSSFRNATSSNQALVLPQSLSALGGLTDHNMINPTYFKIIATRMVSLDSLTHTTSTNDGTTQTTTGHTATTTNQKHVSVMLKINRNMYQSLSGTNYNYQNTAYHNQIWCVISTNDLVATASDKVKVFCSRHVCWRDTKGSSSL